jgi:hypothetical protein
VIAAAAAEVVVVLVVVVVVVSDTSGSNSSSSAGSSNGGGGVKKIPKFKLLPLPRNSVIEKPWKAEVYFGAQSILNRCRVALLHNSPKDHICS